MFLSKSIYINPDIIVLWAGISWVYARSEYEDERRKINGIFTVLTGRWK
jgi:hypothetical protein